MKVHGIPIRSAPAIRSATHESAVLYRPQAQDRFERIQEVNAVKSATLVPLPEGEALHLVQTEGRLLGLKADGDVRFVLETEGRPQLDDHGHFYAVEGSLLKAYDIREGQELRQLDLGVEGATLHRRADGVTLAVNGEVRLLNSRLEKECSFSSSLPQPRAVELGAGSVAVFGGREELEIHDSSGAVVHQGKYSRPTLDAIGRLWYVQGDFGEPKQVVCFDPKTSQARAFSAGCEWVEALYPLPDGSCVVHDHRDYTKCFFRVFSPVGEQVDEFKLTGGSPAQIQVSPDGAHLYVMANLWNSKPDKRVLFRYDLEGKDWLGKLSSGVGRARGGTALVTYQKDREIPAIAVLNDGSLIVAEGHQASLLDSKGKTLAQFESGQRLLDGLGSRRLASTSQSLYRQPALDIETFLRDVDRYEARTNLTELFRDRGGVEVDGIYQFSRTVSRADMMKEIVGADESALESAYRRQLLAELQNGDQTFPRGEVREISAGRGAIVRVDNRWTEDCEPHLTLEVPRPGSQGEVDRVDFYGKSESNPFERVLPFSAPGKFGVAASDDNGYLYWVVAAPQPGGAPRVSKSTYRVPGGIRQLATHEGKVIALGKDGSLLSLDPEGDDFGQAESSTPLLGEVAEGPRIVVTEQEVRVGGVALKRRG